MPAERIYNNRPVFRLRLPATPRLDRILSWTPRPIQSLLQHIFPEWFLPPIIILKEKTTEGAAYFDNELQIYRRLQPLQGDCIPRLLGVAITNDWIPTLVLDILTARRSISSSWMQVSTRMIEPRPRHLRKVLTTTPSSDRT